MTTSPKSFRLSPKARENLLRLAEAYDISEGKALDILLTRPGKGVMEIDLAASEIIEEHYSDLAAARTERH